MMKNGFILLITVFSLILTFCYREKTVRDGTVVISGQIVNNNAANVTISNSDTSFSSTIDENGNFKIEFAIAKAGYYEYRGNERARLYLTPGDRLSLSIDTRAFDETLVFSGKGAEVNNYLAEKFLFNEILFYDRDRLIFSLPEETFLPVMNFIEQVIQERLVRLAEKYKHISPEFIRLEEQSIKCIIANYKIQYPDKYASLTGKQDIQPDKSYYSFINEITFNNIDMLPVGGFRDFIFNYLEIQAKKELADNPSLQKGEFSQTTAMINVIDRTFTNPAMHKAILLDLSWNFVNAMRINDRLMSLIAEKLDKRHYIPLEKTYLDLKPLSRGNKAPDFSLLDLEGKTVTLKDFKGKYVYLDTWSTTCGPCLREIPYLEELKQEYKNKNISIVGVCLSEENPWKEMIAEKELKGIQLRAAEGWNSQFRNDYVKNHGVPCFILIDPEGKIIDARAPRPSENIREVLNKLDI
jgi:thiol-disulfide isomerase/thioredoxin